MGSTLMMCPYEEGIETCSTFEFERELLCASMMCPYEEGIETHVGEARRALLVLRFDDVSL